MFVGVYVPFQGVGSAAGDYLVEVVFHRSRCFILFPNYDFFVV